MVISFESVDEILNWDHSNESCSPLLSRGAVYSAIHWMVLTFETETIQMKASMQYFPLVLVIMLYKVVLNWEVSGEILKGL